jgi:hypothetical protein
MRTGKVRGPPPQILYIMNSISIASFLLIEIAHTMSVSFCFNNIYDKTMELDLCQA